MTKRDGLMTQAAEQYLEGLGVTLWGDWDISKPEGLHEAAKWLVAQIEATLDKYDETLFEMHDFEKHDEALLT